MSRTDDPFNVIVALGGGAVAFAFAILRAKLNPVGSGVAACAGFVTTFALTHLIISRRHQVVAAASLVIGVGAGVLVFLTPSIQSPVSQGDVAQSSPTSSEPPSMTLVTPTKVHAAPSSATMPAMTTPSPSSRFQTASSGPTRISPTSKPTTSRAAPVSIRPTAESLRSTVSSGRIPTWPTDAGISDGPPALYVYLGSEFLVPSWVSCTDDQRVCLVGTPDQVRVYLTDPLHYVTSLDLKGRPDQQLAKIGATPAQISQLLREAR